MKTFCLWWLMLQQWMIIPIYTADLRVAPTGTTIRILGAQEVFTRSCKYCGTSNGFLRLDWLHNNELIKKGEERTSHNQLLIQPEKTYQGKYKCQVIYTNDSIGETVSAGQLLVYDPVLTINAPAVQNVVEGECIHLLCNTTIPQTRTIWRDPSSSSHSGIVDSTAIEDQGDYSCNILETIMGNVIYTTVVTLEVIVPPIISHITPTQETFGNEAVTFNVHFLSSYSHSTTVTWQRNNILIPPDRFKVNYDNTSGGTTSLMFTVLRRVDMGRYRVLIENSLAAIPNRRRSAFEEFVVKIKVSPTAPSAPMFARINNTLTQVSWKLTNTTADSVPDTLLMVIMNYRDSPVPLNSSTKEFLLRTEPGMNSTVIIYAFNQDGRASSPSSLLSIAPSDPSITGLVAVRVNTTAFNITVKLLYTGAGPEGHVALSNIMFRDHKNSSWFQFNQEIELIRKSDSRTDWYALLVHSQFVTLNEVEFSLNIQNNVASGVGAYMTVVGVAVVPGQPVIVSGSATSSNSLAIQARLSSTGTSPILSLNIYISAMGHISLLLMKTTDLVVGGLVEIEVRDLSPDTSYTVVIYAVNVAGRGQDSAQRIFSTANQGSPLPIWAIVVSTVVICCVCVLVVLIFLILVGIRRRNNVKRINLASVPTSPNKTRPDSVGATDSLNSFHNSIAYSFVCNESTSNFVLNPPPDGLKTPRSPTLTSSCPDHHNSHYSSGKSHHYASSISPSESSKPSSKCFMICHSPAPLSIPLMNRAETFQSMPMLENRDHSPSLPPNYATDV